MTDSDKLSSQIHDLQIRCDQLQTQNFHREALHKALQRLQAEIWQMQRAEDIQKVLNILQQTLKDLDISYLYCSVNVIDTHREPPAVSAFNIAQLGPPKFFPLNETSAQTIVRFWRMGKPIYRKNLMEDDPYGEKGYLKDICTVLDVPFSHGTLALSNRAPDAFSPTHIAALEELANAISSVYSRYLDFQQIEAQNRTLEQTLSQLRQSEARFRSIAQSASDAIITANNKGLILSWNKSAQRMFGYREEEVVGQPLTCLMPQRYRQGHQKGIEHVADTDGSKIVGKPLEFHGLRKNGSEFPIELSLATWTENQQTFFSGIIRDISKRKRTEAALHETNNTLSVQNRKLEETLHQLQTTQSQLVMREKMAALGNLVAGIAHELNTPLGAANSAVDTINRCIERLTSALEGSDAPAHQQAPQVQQTLALMRTNNRISATAGERIGRIVQSLKAFSQLDRAPFRKADLHEGLDSALTLLEPQLKDHITLVKDYQSIPLVPCYASELNQVFMNLIINAIQAIDTKGTIWITTSSTECFVQVQIKDDGAGIAPEHLEKIFDPGFTTKGVGVGTGLGLATSYAILQKHKGTITAESQPGQGASFTVQVPLGGNLT